MNDFSNYFRKVTGFATLEYNENPQVVFFKNTSSSAARSSVNKLTAIGFNAYISGLDRQIVIVDLFNVIP